MGTAVLPITHDLGLAAERAEQPVVAHRGRIVESAPPWRPSSTCSTPYTKRLRSQLPPPRWPASNPPTAGASRSPKQKLTGRAGATSPRKQNHRVEGLTKGIRHSCAKKRNDTSWAVDNVFFASRHDPRSSANLARQVDRREHDPPTLWNPPPARSSTVPPTMTRTEFAPRRCPPRPCSRTPTILTRCTDLPLDRRTVEDPRLRAPWHAKQEVAPRTSLIGPRPRRVDVTKLGRSLRSKAH